MTTTTAHHEGHRGSGERPRGLGRWSAARTMSPPGARRLLGAIIAGVSVVAALIFSARPAFAASLAVDTTVTTHQGTASTTITSPVITTHQTNELLIAFLASDGNLSGTQSFSSVTGGGLTWTRRAASNQEPGTAEIWQAAAPNLLSNVTVTATRTVGGYVGSMVVVAFSGADLTASGATSTNSAASGAPSTSLTTKSANSWVWGVGNDWSTATGRSPGSNQTLVDQFLPSVGDTYWVQRQNTTTASAGTTVTINDIAPTSDVWDLAAVEVVAAGGTTTPPPSTPTNLAANVVSAGEVDLGWTGSTSSVGVDHYTVSRDGTNIGTSTTTSYADKTTAGGNTYSYTVAAVDTQGNVSAPSNTATAVTPAAGADVMGQVGSIIPWPIVSIHAALTPSGKVLTFQGDFTQGGQQYLWDPATNVQKQIPNAAADLFCAGQAVLADGRVAVIGGTNTTAGLGIPDVTAFDWNTEQWQNLAPMHYPRWYPTGTTLGDGKVMVNSGANTSAADIVATPEMYNPPTNAWTTMTAAAHSMPIYPFIYQLTDGRILHAGGSETSTATEALDLNTNTWSTVDSRAIDGGSIVNYAPGKFMKAGSATDSGGSGASTNTAYTLDMNQPNATWQPTGSMAHPRAFLNLTALPDGSVLASGGDTEKSGYNDANGVLPMEIWNPATGQWKTVASLTEPRLYHSVAVLLPDGRVFISGGGGDAGVPDHKTAQLYSPPYLFNGRRPTISSVNSTVQYGGSTFVQTPDAASITKVTLIRTGSPTHSFDQNARALTLSFAQGTGGIDVQLPANGNYAPPGYYLLSIVNGNGVPSVSSVVRFPAPYEDTQPPSAVTDLAATADSSTQVTLRWSASTDNQGVVGYNVFRNGVRLTSTPTPGYVDKTAVGSTTYNYTVTAYDGAGNTSAASNTATVTTPGDTTPPVISNVAVSPSSSSATVTWTTDEPSSSQVLYGLDATYGSTTPVDAHLVTSHSQTLTGLVPSTTYHFQVTSVDGASNAATSADGTFTTTAPALLAVDARVSAHPTSSSTRLRSPTFTTTQANDLLVALISADGPSSSGSQSVTGVTGGGVTWTLQARSNAQPGDAEIWTATAPTVLTNSQVTASLRTSAVGSVTVVAFKGAATGVKGKTAVASAGTGPPTATVTTSRANSWIWGVGTDWSSAIARTPGAGQTVVDQYLAPVGDTYWVQRQNNATAGAGTAVAINDTAPTSDSWNLAVVEIPAQ
ncbi:galactose oxidase-like domain-containing protein [Terrabacter sp. NPDC080008]|uniref:galactose oxidase-like domain-containing protein n=1 Tax=Terrabacter sp. NPDC080008 TaxID=3155176 RepID=UPI00344DE573